MGPTRTTSPEETGQSGGSAGWRRGQHTILSMEVRHDEALPAGEREPYLPKLRNSSEFWAGIFGEGVEEEQMCAFRQHVYANLPGLSTAARDSKG